MGKDAFALILLSLLIAPPAAPQPAAAAEGTPVERTVQKWQDMRASELVGAKAVDRNGLELGTIQDLILAADTGDLHYAVVSFGGWLELGDRLYTYPLAALAPGRSPDKVIIATDAKRLRDPASAAELARWLKDFDPNAPVVDRSFVRASALLGKPIADREGKRLGEMEDVVVNLSTGKVRHVVAELGGQRVALPLHAFVVPIVVDRSIVLSRQVR